MKKKFNINDDTENASELGSHSFLTCDFCGFGILSRGGMPRRLTFVIHPSYVLFLGWNHCLLSDLVNFPLFSHAELNQKRIFHSWLKNS